MKSAVIATVFTYLIGALAAPLGSDAPRTENEARALDAVLSGTVPVSRRDARLVNNLVEALAKRQDSTSSEDATSVKGNTSKEDATSTDVTSSSVISTPVVAASPNATPDSKASDKDSATSTDGVAESTPTPLTEIEQKMVADALIEHGANVVAVRQMYADGLFESLLGPLAGILKVIPIVGPLLATLLGTVGGVAGGLPVVGGLVGGAGGAGGANPLGAVTGLLGSLTGGAGGANPLGAVTGLINGLTGGAGGDNPLGAVTGLLGGLTGELGKTVGGVTGGLTGGAGGAGGANPLGAVTGLLGGLTGELGKTVGGVTGGLTGGAGGANPLGAVNGLLGGLTGGLGKAVGGVTGGVLNAVGDITKNPVGVLTDPAGTLGHVVGDVTNGVGQTVKGVAQVAGSVPVVGGAVQAAGNAAGDAVQAAGKALNGATGAIPGGSLTKSFGKRDEQGLVDSLSALLAAVPALGPLLAGLVNTAGNTAKGVVANVPVVGDVANGILKREIENSPEAFNKMLADLQMNANEFQEFYADLMREMFQSAAEVGRLESLDWALSLEEAVKKLEAYIPAGVLVLDAGFTSHRHQARLTASVRQYAKRGGTVIFCAVFPAVISMEIFNSTFRSFGVPWHSAGFQTRLEARRTDLNGNWPESASQVH